MFQEVMHRNAWILGRLASMGIVHDALIPLFHNRIQRGRRDDQGAYEWVCAGRLDRWLYSCEHPNIGVSGVRDFEHLGAFNAPISLPELIESVASMAALCVSGKYWCERHGNAEG